MQTNYNTSYEKPDSKYQSERNAIEFNNMRFDSGNLDQSLNKISITHPIDVMTGHTHYTNAVNKALEASKTTFKGCSPRQEITHYQNGRNSFATNSLVVKPQANNIMDEIYTRRPQKTPNNPILNQNKTRRYDTKKPASMIRVPNNQISTQEETKHLQSEPISIVKGIKTGTEVVQSGRLSQELQKILLPSNAEMMSSVNRNKDLETKSHRLDSGGKLNNLISSIDKDNAYGESQYETSVHKAIGKGRMNRYDVTQQKGTAQTKASAPPMITGQPLQPQSSVVGNNMLQLNAQMISPNSSNNPIKKRFESDMVPFSKIAGREPYHHQTSKAIARRQSSNISGTKIVNIGGASLFNQNSLVSPKQAEINDFIQTSLGCKGTSLPATERQEKRDLRDSMTLPIDTGSHMQIQEIQNVISSANGIEMNRRQRMLALNQAQAATRPKFIKDPNEPPHFQSPSADHSLLEDNSTFDNLNGINNSLNGHPSGKYSLKEIATTNNSMLQKSKNDSLTINQGSTLLTASTYGAQPNHAVTPALSNSENPQQRSRHKIRNQVAPSVSFNQIPNGDCQTNQLNSNDSSNTHMSVAAKAGEMQIFSQDVYGQGNTKHRKKASYNNISLNKISNTVNQRHLSIADSSAQQSFINGDSPEPVSQHLNLSGNGRTLNLANMYGDEENTQVNRPSQSQTYGEYVAGKSRMVEERLHRHQALSSNNINPPSSMNVSDLRELYGISQDNRNYNFNSISQSQRDSNGPSASIAIQQIQLNNQQKNNVYQCQIKCPQTSTSLSSNAAGSHLKSENQLQINVQQTVPNSPNEFSAIKNPGDQQSSYTPTAIRNSIGGRSATKYDEYYQERNNSTDRQAEMNYDLNKPIRNLGLVQTNKLAKVQQQSSQMSAPNERNDHFPNKITSKERPPHAKPNAKIQTNAKRQNAQWEKPLGISGEQLKISLTGTRVQGQTYYQQQQQMREQQFMQFKDGAYSSVSGQYNSNNSQIPSSQRNMIKSKILEQGNAQNFFNGQNQQNHFIPNSMNPQTALIANDFLQQQMQLGMMSSPKSGNIFQQDTVGGHTRIYSYHFIYEYLFVQVSEKQFQKEYQPRIRLRRLNYQSDINVLKEQNDTDGSEEDQPFPFKPTIESKKLQLSPHRSRATRQLEDGQMIGGQDIEKETKQIEARSKSVSSLHEKPSNIEESKDKSKPAKRLPSINKVFQAALQGTQHDGLKVLTPDSIYKAYEDYIENNPEENLNSISEFTIDECLAVFMTDVSVLFTEQNKRFKVTVKKKYINDILMCSKGAQNVAQQVIMVVTNNDALALNSAKKIRKVKRNMSVDMESDDEGEIADAEGAEAPQKIPGQKTPQVTSNKAVKAAAAAATRRGYESDDQAKSLNSTTTSSTFPNLKTGTNQANTPKNPRKMGTGRSLSQIPNSVRLNRKGADELGKEKDYMTISVDDIANHYSDKYPPTKIKIVQKVEHNLKHMTHPINRMLSDYNEFTKVVFRTRVTEQRALQNIPYAIKIGKRLGIQLSRNSLMPATLKVRENSNAIKEKIILHLCKVLNAENKFQPDENVAGSVFQKALNQSTLDYMTQQQKNLALYEQQRSLASHYKCYIGKGNNSMMVRTLFKSRYWWLLHDKEEIDKVNFMWTQLKKGSIMNTLKCKLVNNKDKQAVKEPVTNMHTPNNKLKKRKVSSAQSRSPETGTDTNEKQGNGLVLNKLNSEAHFQEDQKSPSAAKDKEEKKEDQSVAKLMNQPTKIEQFPYKLYNKIEDNYHLSNKKALFVNMKMYYEAMHQDPFDSLPVTFHVKEGIGDINFQEFSDYYDNRMDTGQLNMWIIKPGENTNRGQGIQVAKEFNEIKQIIEDSTRTRKRTCIVQKYIHNPLLYNRRKFDIRTYALATSINGNFKGFYYQEGYLRTSCREFNLHNVHNRMIHLTNDAVQKKCEDYGKFEPGNKLSYNEFQNYLDKNYGTLNVCFERDILPQIKKLTADCFRASWGKMDPNKRINTFEVYGLDFMLDENFKVYLIEVNTNPCLELASPLLARLIPSMLENALRIAVDPIFPPPENFSQRKHVVNELCPENKYDLVFDERIDGPELQELLREKDNVILEIDEEELSDSEEFDDED